jgi:hypothetical protein
MTDDRDLDAALRSALGGVRQIDAAQAPAFGPMMARARAAAAATDSATPIAPAGRSRRSPLRLIAWGTPVLVAAGLGAIWIISDGNKDREFERAVSEWSAREASLRSPTDQLLAIPGSEFLGGLPAVGRPAPRRGM